MDVRHYITLAGIDYQLCGVSRICIAYTHNNAKYLATLPGYKRTHSTCQYHHAASDTAAVSLLKELQT